MADNKDDPPKGDDQWEVTTLQKGDGTSAPPSEAASMTPFDPAKSKLKMGQTPETPPPGEESPQTAGSNIRESTSVKSKGDDGGIPTEPSTNPTQAVSTMGQTKQLSSDADMSKASMVAPEAMMSQLHQAPSASVSERGSALPPDAMMSHIYQAPDNVAMTQGGPTTAEPVMSSIHQTQQEEGKSDLDGSNNEAQPMMSSLNQSIAKSIVGVPGSQQPAQHPHNMMDCLNHGMGANGNFQQVPSAFPGQGQMVSPTTHPTCPPGFRPVMAQQPQRMQQGQRRRCSSKGQRQQQMMLQQQPMMQQNGMPQNGMPQNGMQQNGMQQQQSPFQQMAMEQQQDPGMPIPTGATTTNSHRYSANPWELEQIPPYDFRQGTGGFGGPQQQQQNARISGGAVGQFPPNVNPPQMQDQRAQSGMPQSPGPFPNSGQFAGSNNGNEDIPWELSCGNIPNAVGPAGAEGGMEQSSYPPPQAQAQQNVDPSCVPYSQSAPMYQPPPPPPPPQGCQQPGVSMSLATGVCPCPKEARSSKSADQCFKCGGKEYENDLHMDRLVGLGREFLCEAKCFAAYVAYECIGWAFDDESAPANDLCICPDDANSNEGEATDDTTAPQPSTKSSSAQVDMSEGAEKEKGSLKPKSIAGEGLPTIPEGIEGTQAVEEGGDLPKPDEVLDTQSAISRLEGSKSTAGEEVADGEGAFSAPSAISNLEPAKSEVDGEASAAPSQQEVDTHGTISGLKETKSNAGETDGQDQNLSGGSVINTSSAISSLEEPPKSEVGVVSSATSELPEGKVTSEPSEGKLDLGEAGPEANQGPDEEKKQVLVTHSAISHVSGTPSQEGLPPSESPSVGNVEEPEDPEATPSKSKSKKLKEPEK